MRNKHRISLNLATHPSRNRRLFISCLAFLGAVFLLLSVFGGIVYFSYVDRDKEVKTSLLKIDQSIRKLQDREQKTRARIDKIAADYKETVNAINGLIFRKSFSWVDFLSCLEESLPDSSYIVSLAPTLTDELQVRVRVAVISRSLDDLLDLINNLRRMRFKNISVLNEVRNKQGLLRSEISLIYERNI